MSARQLVMDGTVRLEAAGVPEAKIKMEWWVGEALGIRREELDTTFPAGDDYVRVEKGIDRLARHEPLQHVIGHTPFLDLTLTTDARALVPRPETEELVMRVLGCRALWSRGAITVADVGTGSGCIAIAVASKRPTARVLAIDSDAGALALARTNAESAGVAVQIEFIQGDLLTGIPPQSLDAVVSNPPYIATSVLATLEDSVRRYEPMTALDGGPDGLDVLRRLAVQAFTALNVDGRIWLEIGDEQGDPVHELLVQAGFREVEINRDMYGQTRFAEGIKCSRP